MSCTYLSLRPTANYQPTVYGPVRDSHHELQHPLLIHTLPTSSPHSHTPNVLSSSIHSQHPLLIHTLPTSSPHPYTPNIPSSSTHSQHLLLIHTLPTPPPHPHTPNTPSSSTHLLMSHLLLLFFQVSILLFSLLLTFHSQALLVARQPSPKGVVR